MYLYGTFNATLLQFFSFLHGKRVRQESPYRNNLSKGRFDNNV